MKKRDRKKGDTVERQVKAAAKQSSQEAKGTVIVVSVTNRARAIE